jgi:hypothetical protein
VKYVTPILFAIASATPLLTALPKDYQAVGIALIALVSALYHLYQPAPN